MGEDITDGDEKEEKVISLEEETIRKEFLALFNAIEHDPRIKEIRKKQELEDILKSRIEEFMSCYRLVGFDYSGRPITISASHNVMERSALDSIFTDEFSKFMESKMMRQ